MMNHRNLSPDHLTAWEIVRLLKLEPLDREGGYFRRTGGGPAWSTIYFLATPEGFSAMHRVTKDEVWCFHAGDTLESLRLRPDGSGEWVKLGLNVARGERPQDVVAAQTWQGTRLAAGGRWALVSCVVAPAFTWSDFELGSAEVLVTAYPRFADDIRKLTRAVPPAGAK